MCSLHYTTVELGTPGVKFMVALDTGSDLFWVPCDCSRCAPTHGASYASVCISSQFLLLFGKCDFFMECGFVDFSCLALSCPSL